MHGLRDDLFVYKEPSPLIIVYDHCAFLHDYSLGCLGSGIGGITVWEPSQQQTYTISRTRYVASERGITTDHSLGIIEFGHCAVQ